VVAKVEFHAGELFPRVGFIVTNLETPSRSVVRFYNKRGTAEQWIKEGKQAVKMTRLSCHRFRSNQARLALSLLAYNLGNLWRRLALPKRIENWSLTSLQQRLVKTGGRLVKHARYYWLLLAEGHLTRRRFGGRCWAGSRYYPRRRDRERGWSSLHRKLVLSEGWARRSIAKTGRKMVRFWPCPCGWQTAGSAPIEKSFRNVAIRRDGHTMVSFSRSKRKFRLKLSVCPVHAQCADRRYDAFGIAVTNPEKIVIERLRSEEHKKAFDEYIA